MSKGFGANATRLLIAAVTGFRGVQFNFGNLLSRYATPAKASYEERPTSYARKTAGFDQPGREHTVGDALGLRRNR
jgi:hypothetical protein